jgi:hypothetical protein
MIEGHVVADPLHGPTGSDPQWSPFGAGIYIMGIYQPCCGGTLAEFLAEADRIIETLGAEKSPGRPVGTERKHRMVEVWQIPKPARTEFNGRVRKLTRAGHRGIQVVQVWRLWDSTPAEPTP